MASIAFTGRYVECCILTSMVFQTPHDHNLQGPKIDGSAVIVQQLFTPYTIDGMFYM